MKKNEFIKQIRQKYKMSQKKFAEYLEVSKSLIEKVEMGRSEATPENKYVKAVCALEGLDNEIFSYDEITDEVLQEHELSKFSKAFRKFLYFYYGDFWNENIEENLLYEVKQTLETFSSSTLKNIKHKDEFINIDLNQLKDKIKILSKEKITKHIHCEECHIIKMIIILALNLFNLQIKPSSFVKLREEIQYLVKLKVYIIDNNFTKLLINDEIIEKLEFFERQGQHLYIDYIKLNKPKPMIIRKISSKDYKPINLTTLKYVISTDPKDKQICELLQYAPTAFKDKIIEKLLQYKKDVEEF